MPGNTTWYNDLSTIRKMMKDMDFGAICPSCKMPFDKGKKRKLTDVCGHDRCYSCVFNSDKCALCVLNANNDDNDNDNDDVSLDDDCEVNVDNVPFPQLQSPEFLGSKTTPSNFNEDSISGHHQLPPVRPKMKTNGHFTPYMQTRSAHCATTSNGTIQLKTNSRPDVVPRLSSNVCSAEASPVSPRKKYRSPSPSTRIKPWLRRPVFHSSTTNIETCKNSSLTDSENGSIPPPPPAHAAKNDLYMRLGLLLGDRVRGQRKGSSSQSSQSSLNSSENTNTSSNISPLSTLTGFSESESLTGPSLSICSSLDPSCESVASASPTGTLPRRHSVTTTSPGPVEDLYFLDKRKAPIRRSARAGNIKGPLDPRIRFAPYRPPQINLKPQFFEVPQNEKDQMFVGRQWLFKEIEQELCSSSTNSGVVIVGGTGNGKTSIILQLVEHSCFGRRRDESNYQEIHGSRGSLSSSSSCYSLVTESVRNLGGQVVAYHFCQADNNATCLVPDFVHNMAAQLCQAPQLAAYRSHLGLSPHLQTILSLKECIANPSTSFIRGILEPLRDLRSQNKIPASACLIVVDALDEAEYHRPDFGQGIAAFLAAHVEQFPCWLKVIATVRTNLQEVVKNLPYRRISLDRISTNEHLQRDLHDYITKRIKSSPTVPNNIAINGKMDAALQTRFTSHLLHLSLGSFLYLRLTLNLVEEGRLVMKSTSFKVLPQNLSEIYMLHFNLKFPSLRSYEKVVNILNVCLASLYPMNLLEIYHSVNAGSSQNFLLWEDFLQRMDILTNFLVCRQDGSYMFFHPSFREWLIRRDKGTPEISGLNGTPNQKFLCNPRSGHCNVAFRMSRLESPLDDDKTCELGHHILKAHIYKNVGLTASYSPRDMQALWLCQSSTDISKALAAPRNLYSPNVKVSRLLLLSGANPDQRTPSLDGAPIMSVFACLGFVEMVSLLIEFGGDVNLTNKLGKSTLSFAAETGNTEIVRLLYNHGAQINYVDSSGHCALTYAALCGHVAVTSFLLQNDWPNSGCCHIGLQEAAQRALVLAAANGHTQVCDYLLNLQVVGVDLTDHLVGSTPLCSSSSGGHRETASLLLRRGASVSCPGPSGQPPLMAAVQKGHWEVADLLLLHLAEVDQVNFTGKTSLMVAAAEGHLGVLEFLLNKGAAINAVDREGQTALCWAAAKGQPQTCLHLLERGADINHPDKTGRTPLDFAAASGEPSVVQLLLDRGALVEHVDHSGMRPLDRAISCRNSDATLCFLRKGAKLGPSTWALAAGKWEIVLLLLNKLNEDGSVLYKKNRIVEASHRYQYALKKFPTQHVGENHDGFRQLKMQMMLSLVRCKRKLNDFDSALDLIDQVLELNGESFEAHYARARVRRDMKQFSLALDSMAEAIKLAPPHRDIRRILIRIQDEIKELENPTNLLEFGHLAGSLDGIEQEVEGVVV